jgi:shikimate dehydrogenase
LAKALRQVNKKVKGIALSNETLKEELKDTDILVNATSVGMYPDINKSPVPKSLLHPNLWVMDIIYAPLETKLAKDAKARGANLISGVEMLIYQGAASFEIWTQHPAPVTMMKRSVLSRIS